MGYKWRIKARVVKKGEKRTWKNDKGEGYLMNVVLMDEDGTQIQGTFFKENADKYYKMLKENSVYMMMGGLVKESSPRFATIKNEYCIVFDRFTDIKELVDDGTVAKNQVVHDFTFTAFP